MYDIKQVVILRNDLKMRRGKSEAQCAHASMKVFFDRMKITRSDPDYYTLTSGGCKSCCHHYVCQNITDSYNYENCSYFEPWASIRSNFTKEMIEWMEGSFAKIVVGVDSLEQLLDLERQAKEADIPCALITDNGSTEFKSYHCVVCDSENLITFKDLKRDFIERYRCLDCETEFETVDVIIKNKPTITCLAIGPDISEKIDKITGGLKLR